MSFWGRKLSRVEECGKQSQRSTAVVCCVCVCIRMIDIGSRYNKHIAAGLIAKPKCKPKHCLAYLAI